MSKRILNKISSKYLIDILFSYIQISHFKLKLFSYSKFYQKKFNLDLNDYINTCLESKSNYKKYLCCFEDFYGKYSLCRYSDYGKDKLKEKLESDLKYVYKMDMQTFTQKIINFFNIYSNKYKEIILLDIFSPFFDSLSQLPNFYKIFTIPIAINRPIIIKEGNSTRVGFPDCNFNALNDYISVFDRLNKSNIKYSISISFQDFLEYYLYSHNEESYKEYWKNFKINIENTSGLLLFDHNNYGTDMYGDYILPENGTKRAFAELSLFDYIKFKNLKYLKLDFVFIPKEEPSPQKLINFPDVEECDLVEFRFKKEKENIETGNFDCDIIYYSSYSYEYNPDKTIMNLEYSKIFDFSIIKKIKILTIEVIDFLHLNNNILLEKIIIYSIREIDKETEKKMIEKLISIKTLKDITFSLKMIEDKEILQIKGENNSVINLKLYIFKKDCEIYYLQQKFPNLINLSISNLYKSSIVYNDQLCQFCKERYLHGNINNNEVKNILNNKIKGIMIKDEQNCNINKLILNIGDSSNVKLFISFEKLIEIKLIGLLNFNNFPIFNKNCNIVFNSLTHFECKVGIDHYISCYEEFCEYYNQKSDDYYENGCGFLSYYYNNEMKDFLNNIYNNIRCMPNLKDFIYEFPSSIEENIYLDLIKILLEKKLNTIVLRLYNNKSSKVYSNINQCFGFDFSEYTFEELKSFYPNINEFFRNKYKIGKYNSLFKK